MKLDLLKNREAYKRRIYEIVEVGDKNDYASRAYDLMILTGVIIGMIPLMMKSTNIFVQMVDGTTGFIFLFDYLIRLFTSDYKMGYKSYKAYLWYIFTPMAIVDFLSLIPFVAVFLPTSTFWGMFRIFRVFRILKLVRYSNVMVVITNVIRKVKRQLFAIFLLTAIYITASAMFIFQIEPDLFNNFLDALYWATISITTIGYGDISPVTTAGRILTMISSLVGLAVIALPSGVITAAYMNEIKKKKGKYEI
ncbi:MAG: ion transporter [Eubacterium sp.]|nr:ion transporter [Eubacterium sp.]